VRGAAASATAAQAPMIAALYFIMTNAPINVAMPLATRAY
jgi:hypothetical protein